MSREQVPASALRFSVGELELGDNGEGSKSAPFRMVARSGRAIEHWYWGAVVHDLDGMHLAKSRVAIDYIHDEREVIGYANAFNTSGGELVASGALVPYKDSDRASEVIHKSKAGVPYEASINFGGDGIKIQRIPEGETTQVNGFEFSGPGVVIREWPLRGIAVCPYGADSNTSTEFSADATVTVEVSEDEMATDQLNTEVVEETNQQQPEAEAVEGTTVAVTDTDAEATESSEAVEAVTLRSEGEKFLAAFGDQGGVWFAQGKTFQEASELFLASIREENEQLKRKLAAFSSDGEKEPVTFSNAPGRESQPLIRLANRK